VGWSIGYDDRWKRDIGYGVPAYCDHPGCMKEINRGLSYVCGGEPYGGEYGCGLFFCGEHMFCAKDRCDSCARCAKGEEPFDPTQDHPTWITHKLTDASWAQWRAEYPQKVEQLTRQLEKEAT